MIKVLNKKITDILCYFSVPGWVLALILGDFQKSKVHMNQAMVIGMLKLLVDFGIMMWQLLFGGTGQGIINILKDMEGLFFLALSLMGIFRALRGNDTPMPVVGHIRILY